MWPRHEPSGRLLRSLRVTVRCGRCERPFEVNLKKGKDNPKHLCSKCGIENQLPLIWRRNAS